MNQHASVGATVQIVIDRIFARIQTEEYPADSRLPSERTLASELGVARNTVREALDVLEGRGVIIRRAGSGSYVTFQSRPENGGGDNQVGADTSPLEHLVVRSVLEPEIVRLAVINMSPRQIEALGVTLSELENVQTDAAAFIGCEEAFYRQIADGAGNALLASCYQLTIEAGKQNFRAALLRRHLTPRRIQDYQRRYNALFNAIAARDIETAVEYIKLHLTDEQKLILQDG